MNVGSTFSGVGGLDLGLERAGMSVLWQAEVDEWCRRVLRWHWPDAEIYDDVRGVGKRSANLKPNLRGDRSGADPSGGKQSDKGRDGWPPSVDLLCGGFPCQDLSVAGKRAGLAGERSGLFFEFARIADELRPTWLLVENVVGLLSSANGKDFGIVLSTLAEIGYGLSWRVADARYFGVPQRRRRVFIVGCLGDDGERAVRALGTGGEGDLEAGRCSWQDASCGTGDGVEGSSGKTVMRSLIKSSGQQTGHNGLDEQIVVSPPITRKWGTSGSAGPSGDECQNLVNAPVEQRKSWPAEVAPTLNTAYGTKMGLEDQHALGGAGLFVPTEPTAKCLMTGNHRFDPETETYVLANALDRMAGGPDDNSAQANHLVAQSSVRRLTPTECERLMSWPDGWTAVDGDKTPDSRRYAACGNGVVSNVAEWIGRRIMAVENE